MLADGLSTAYRWVQTDKTFLKVDPECLQWTYRGLRLIEEILRFDPDIIAIEECDQLPFIMQYLKPKGYDSKYQEKTKSPIRHVIKAICEERKIDEGSFKMPNDGIALIYKIDKFQLINEEDVQYIDMKKNKEKVIGLSVPLKIKTMNDREVLFVVTHLKSTKSQEGEELRERQINLLLNELVKNDKNLPVILCCDLNANPVQNKKGYDPLCYNSITNKDNLGYESVYKLANGSEPEYTTWKLREHGTDKHVLDYIFLKNGKWNIDSLLSIPEASGDLEALIPNWHYPSDHFSIMAQLSWKQDDGANDDEKKSEDDGISLPLPGQCLIEATFDLEKDLQLLRNRFYFYIFHFFVFLVHCLLFILALKNNKKKRYGDKYAELLGRKMVNIECDNVDQDDIDNKSITVMQFKFSHRVPFFTLDFVCKNIFFVFAVTILISMLADGLSEAYTAKQTDKTFLKVDKEALHWTYRGIRLVEEILRFKADIIAIEECDQLQFLMKYLKQNGYDSFYQIKEKSPIKKVEEKLRKERKEEITMAKDGVALIYKTDKFEKCGDVQQITADNKEKIFGLAVPLKIKNIDQEVLFIVTHLKSTKTQEGEELRERQINLLLKELVRNDKNLPIILCCDLNANPVQNKKGYDPLCYNSITNKDNLGYESVYKLANGSEPEYTTWKLREHGTDKHVLDYIFLKNGNWNITKILDIPSGSSDLEALIPNWHYPSDHFSIMAQLTWK